MVIAMCRRWCAVTCLSIAAIGQPAQAGPACEAQLSNAQRHRFMLALQACAQRPAPAAARTDHQADALVATDPPAARAAGAGPAAG